MTNLAEVMQKTGLTQEQVERVVKQIEARKLYNQRPEVKAKRKQYNAKRALVMKNVREALKGVAE